MARDDRTVTNANLAKMLPDIEVKPILEDENDGDEDWNALVPNPASVQSTVKETLKKAEQCQLITLTEKICGRIEISNHFLYFYDTSEKNAEAAEFEQNFDFKWSLSCLKEIYLRRYNLRRSAIELFMYDQVPVQNIAKTHFKIHLKNN